MYILPIAKKIAAQTLSQDIVTVRPMGLNPDINKIKNEVKVENRKRKINSILENKDFKEMKIVEHPDYKPGINSSLFYLDFKYDIVK